MQLRITEIFQSLQGESSSVGFPTIFVRLTGCPLRCVYCDTSYAFQGGQKLAIEDVIASVRAFPAKYVTVTGGEPLAQPGCVKLLHSLCEASYQVSLETSGALSIQDVDLRVRTVMDFKTPSSGEVDKNYYDNVQFLKPTDEVKFVIGNRVDYDWSKSICEKYNLYSRVNVLFSPVYGVIENRVLADWIVSDGLMVRFQLQLHKYIWGEEPGR